MVVSYPILLRGLPTKGLTDDTQAPSPRVPVFEVSTGTYRTVAGGSKTVFVLEPFDMKEVQPHLDRLNAERKAKLAAQQALRLQRQEEEERRNREEERKELEEKLRQEKRAAEREADRKRSPKYREMMAGIKLRMAKMVAKTDQAKYKQRLQELTKEYPETKAAGEAKAVLKYLK